MFERNYLKKLAFDNIRKQKSFYRFLFISIVLVFALSSVISILFSSFDSIGYQERYEEYGSWSTMFNDLSHEELEKLKSFDKDLKVGNIYHIGDVDYQGRYIGSLDSLDQNSIELTPLTLVEGRFPTHQKEIVIEENQCLLMNIPKSINQTIELTIHENDETYTQQYQVVGIVKGYTQNILELGSFLTTQKTSLQSQILLYSENNKDLWNEVIAEGLYEKASLNQMTYSQYQNYDNDHPHYFDSDYTIFMRYFIVSLGFAGIFGTMVSSLSKRTRYLTLMKAMGATSKQIQKMIVYEGVMLSMIAGVIGLLIGFLLSFIVLFAYHLYMHRVFMLTIGSMFYIQLLILIITTFIAIFIPSLNAYDIPNIQRIKFNIKLSKSQKIRKLNIFSLAIEEFTTHKFISIALTLIVIIGIYFGVIMMESIDSFYQSMAYIKNTDLYDYKIELSEQIADSTEMSLLTENEGISSQIIYRRDLNITWQGIEKQKDGLQFRTTYESYAKYGERASLVCYEDEQMLKELLSKYHMQGRFPVNDHEVLLLKPWITFHENGQSISIVKVDFENYSSDVGLEIGDLIYGFDSQQNNKAIDEPFEIVGTIQFESLSDKEQSLFDNSYQLIMSHTYYQKYFQRDSQTVVLADIKNNHAINQFKNDISKIIAHYEYAEYTDTSAEQQRYILFEVQFVSKMVSFCGILVSGIVTLTYLYRKIKILGARHEIGLYRAIGATKKQIYGIHLLYGLIIYMLALFIIIPIVISNLMRMEGSLWELILAYIDIKIVIYVCILAIVFIGSMILPVWSALKENLLETMSRD